MKFATILPLALALGFLPFASQAFAATANAPLPAGKPAGVHGAQFEGGNGMLLAAGLSLIGITAVLATAGNGVPGSPSTTAPTSTSTTGTSP